MGTHYDVIVIGAGSMGMSSGYYLAKKGVKTLLVDAFDPPHTNGNHHGDTRIIRHAYGEGRKIRPSSSESSGAVGHSRKKRTSPFSNEPAFGVWPLRFSVYQRSDRQWETVALPLELLKAEEVSKRWPGVRLPEGFHACFEPTSGVLFSENRVKAFRHLAQEHGAALSVHTLVEDIAVNRNFVQIETSKGA